MKNELKLENFKIPGTQKEVEDTIYSILKANKTDFDVYLFFSVDKNGLLDNTIKLRCTYFVDGKFRNEEAHNNLMEAFMETGFKIFDTEIFTSFLASILLGKSAETLKNILNKVEDCKYDLKEKTTH